MKTGDVATNAAKEIVPTAEAEVLADMRVEQGTEMEVDVMTVEGGQTGGTVRPWIEGASLWAIQSSHASYEAHRSSRAPHRQAHDPW